MNFYYFKNNDVMLKRIRLSVACYILCGLSLTFAFVNCQQSILLYSSDCGFVVGKWFDVMTDSHKGRLEVLTKHQYL